MTVRACYRCKHYSMFAGCWHPSNRTYDKYTGEPTTIAGYICRREASWDECGLPGKQWEPKEKNWFIRIFTQ